ncbi:MAG: hypothetical protein ACRDTX_26925 [Pseudonocardiaceae bacterium]
MLPTRSMASSARTAAARVSWSRAVFRAMVKLARSGVVAVASVTAIQLMEALVAERRRDRPVPPMAGTAVVGAVVHLLAAAIEEGRDLSSMAVA